MMILLLVVTFIILMMYSSLTKFRKMLSKATGCPRPEFTERNSYSSEIKHFRPYIGKAQMCFRSEQFVYTYQLFVYKKDKIAENVTIFQSCFLGLVVRVRAAIRLL